MAVASLSEFPQHSAISKYVRRIEHGVHGPHLSVFVVQSGLPRSARLQVLAEVIERFPNSHPSLIGDEIAVFARETAVLKAGYNVASLYDRNEEVEADNIFRRPKL